MDLFTYLMAKNGHNTSVHGDLYAYLLGKNNSTPNIATGTTLEITAKKTKINKLILDKESSQDETPTLENPVEINTVKGYRNLLSSSFENTSANNIRATIDNIKAGNYTISFDLEIVSTGQYQVTVKKIVEEVTTTIAYDYNTTTLSFELDEDATVEIDVYKQEILASQITNAILNIGTIALPYVPYGTNYINVNITNGADTKNISIPLNDNELVGIGDYKDELIVDNLGHCYLNKKTGKVILDGINNTFEATGSTNTSGLVRFRTSDIGSKLSSSSSEVIPLFCNKLVAKSLDSTYLKVQGISYLNSSNKLSMYINDISSYTLEQANEWLETNNLLIYYVLQTPQLIDLNTTIDISLYKGSNTITNSEDANMTLYYF